MLFDMISTDASEKPATDIKSNEYQKGYKYCSTIAATIKASVMLQPYTTTLLDLRFVGLATISYLGLVGELQMRIINKQA